MNFFRSTTGVAAFSAAVVLEVVGVIWIYRLLNNAES